MKANNRNGIDCFEADVEFTPPTRSCTNGSTSMYTAVGTTDDTSPTTTTGTNTTIHCGTVPVEAEELMLYRSKCHIDDIPNVARGMTWNDPFYDVNDHGGTPQIIAAFDIDRTLYDQSTYKIFEGFILIPIAGFCTLPIWIVFGITEVFFSLYILYGFLLLINYLKEDCKRSEAKARISRMHIAISTRGIYIDESDVPGSFTSACRTTIKYDEIKKCQVKSEYNYLYRTMHYKITINTKDDCKIKIDKCMNLDCLFGVQPAHDFLHQYQRRRALDNAEYVPKYTIVGIQNQQKFVDIVNAMMEHQAHCATTSNNSSMVVESRVAYTVDGLV